MDREKSTDSKKISLGRQSSFFPDEVVAEYDGHGIQLVAGPSRIYLEPEVLVALENFIGACYGGSVGKRVNNIT